jgi:hypothetical protein
VLKGLVLERVRLGLILFGQDASYEWKGNNNFMGGAAELSVSRSVKAFLLQDTDIVDNRASESELVAKVLLTQKGVVVNTGGWKSAVITRDMPAV